ncbi:hypothetical protein [Epilithonimonas xixisoli]|uniref:hypothetical protein n=1 Tax=Epilithonimonas xixisoli TaxID=1476462 RepID=UPI0014170B63|nr:hypothetical protein [Epilithonimonas xixisoli]
MIKNVIVESRKAIPEVIIIAIGIIPTSPPDNFVVFKYSPNIKMFKTAISK